MEVPLKLTLKELYTGTTKRLKITRRVYNKQTGKLEPKEVCPRPSSASLQHNLLVSSTSAGDVYLTNCYDGTLLHAV